VGYRGEAPKLGLDWELLGYQNYVNDLIFISAVNKLPAAQAYDPVNATYLLGSSTFINDPVGYIARGGELGVTWSATKGLDVRLSSALQEANLIYAGLIEILQEQKRARLEREDAARASENLLRDSPELQRMREAHITELKKQAADMSLLADRLETIERNVRGAS